MDYDDVVEKIEASIGSLADKAETTGHPSVALKYAMAANELAEARAWLMSVSQHHGGRSYSEASK